MEELQLLIKLVADLPTMAIWVLVGFYAYKVVVIGSIYGVIRFCVGKIHDWAIKPKRIEYTIGNYTLGKDVPILLSEQLGRLSANNFGCIQAKDVDILRRAIDVVLADKKENKA